MKDLVNEYQGLPVPEILRKAHFELLKQGGRHHSFHCGKEGWQFCTCDIARQLREAEKGLISLRSLHP
jgi:hypothetical protein